MTLEKAKVSDLGEILHQTQFVKSLQRMKQTSNIIAWYANLLETIDNGVTIDEREDTDYLTPFPNATTNL